MARALLQSDKRKLLQIKIDELKILHEMLGDTSISKGC